MTVNNPNQVSINVTLENGTIEVNNGTDCHLYLKHADETIINNNAESEIAVSIEGSKKIVFNGVKSPKIFLYIANNGLEIINNTKTSLDFNEIVRGVESVKNKATITDDEITVDDISIKIKHK